MKKLILSILFVLCLSFQASALGPMMELIGGGVAANGEIGDSSAESGYGGAAINYYYFSGWTATTAGNVRYLRAWSGDGTGTGTACLTLWDSGGSPLGNCTVTYTATARAWKHCDMGSAVTLDGVSTYYLSLSELTGDILIAYGQVATPTDYDNWGAINCGVDDGLADDGDVGTNTIILHADNINSATP